MPAHRAPHPAVGPLEVSVGIDTGQRRQRNEDAVRIEDPQSAHALARGWVGVVADGLGGRPGGDRASQLAVGSVHEAFYREPIDDASQRLAVGINRAHHLLKNAHQTTPELRGMASTVVAAAVRDGRLTVAWVGDSRAYLIRRNVTRRLTVDHTWAVEAVERGLLTEEQAVNHPQRNQVTRSLGSDQPPTIDIVEEELQPGDTILLCSDGLYRLVDEAELPGLVRGSIGGVAQRLVTLANARGGDDNITVVVARVPRDVGVTDQIVRRWPLLAGIVVASAIVASLLLFTVERSTRPPNTGTRIFPPVATGARPATVPDVAITPTPGALQAPPGGAIVAATGAVIVPPRESATPTGATPTPDARSAGMTPSTEASPSPTVGGAVSVRPRPNPDGVNVRSAPDLTQGSIIGGQPFQVTDVRLAALPVVGIVRGAVTGVGAGSPLWFKVEWNDPEVREAYLHCSVVEALQRDGVYRDGCVVAAAGGP